MGLREQARIDLTNILADKDAAFGYDITVTDPNGTIVPMVGRSTDIGAAIDPETGTLIAGRVASVALGQDTLLAAFNALPINITDEALKPWRCDFLDINGTPGTFKVVDVLPDRALGLIICFLQTYKAS